MKMEELIRSQPNELSDDLSVITVEIKTYQNVAGEAIFEIGKRLKHVKENDLAHGQWIKWVESELGMDRTTSFKFIKVYEQLNQDVDTYQHLGSNALYQIATLPEEERTKTHVTSKGVEKEVQDMTVKELKELKKQLKAKEEQLKTKDKIISDKTKEVKGLKDDNQYLYSKNHSLKGELEDLYNEIDNIEPEVKEVEVVKEVVKTIEVESQITREMHDFTKKISEELQRVQDENKTLKEKLSQIEGTNVKDVTDENFGKDVISNPLKQLTVDMEKIVSKYSYLQHLEKGWKGVNKSEFDRFTSAFDALESFMNKLENTVKNNI